MATPSTPVFRGRTSERDQLGGLIRKVQAGESAAVVVRGEAGIGKTALLDHCVGQAVGFSIARIAGTQSEMELPFAGLHQLCAPMLAEAGGLPEPQQTALQVAFGLISGEVPDRFLVALASLSLLAEVGQKRPLLCVVDDAQWLDAASSQALGFVARRILAESVLMLFAVREPSGDRQLAGLPEIVLHGLGDNDARDLLIGATPRRIDASVRDRLIAETRGNPLAILELPKAMTAVELGGGFPSPHSGDLSGQLEQHFLQRLKVLPEETQQLVLVAAADPTGDVSLLWRAAHTLGLGPAASAATGADQLVEFGERVRFRHPLVRSAIYSGATSEDRRAAHRALAEATDPHTDPDRRAWHLALAVPGTDENVAAELERSASRAQSRGGLASAAAFLQRSVVLTRDSKRRGDRALAAAQVQVQVGGFDAALRLLGTAESDATNELQLARIELLRGHIAAATGPVAEAPARLLKAAKQLEPLDLKLARETYLDALGSAIYTGEHHDHSQMREVAKAALAAPASADPGLTDLLLDGLSLLVIDGMAEAKPTLSKALDTYPNEELSVERGLLWGTLTATAAQALWDLESCEAILSRQSENARRAGALAPLCFTLSGVVFMMVLRGELTAAAALAREVDALTDTIGLPQLPQGGLLVAAFTGDEPQSSAFIRAGIDLAGARGEGGSVIIGHWAEAVLSNGLARYEQALSASQQSTEGALEWVITPWVLPELIEAAVRTGNEAVAIDALERLAESTKWSEGDWGPGILARCQALVSDGDTANELYRTAIECFSRAGLRPDQARARLLYGEWLRRQNRRMDAREQLRRAYEMFSEIGMLAFAQRALHELRATGETVRKRQEDTRDDLTPQEELIARLALDGLTNREIGAQMFLSPRTVEWHLRKVFIKLGVTSRRGLRDALPARARQK
jgi:DNA-binding CsgD family transcriptional regulator/predicted negative regulator of RcsB-dependent stress response